METGKPIYIHAGAHRTGTSSFQMCLAINRKALEGAGFDLAYPGRDGIPDGRLGLRLPSPRHGMSKQGLFAGKVAGAIRDHSPDPARALILSEENIPGPMRHFRKGRFYPAAGARCDALARGGAERPRHLLFVLRTYGELFASGHRKRAEDNAVDPFADGAAARARMDRGWAEIVELMHATLKPAAMTVITYPRRGRSVDLLTAMVPELAGLPLAEPDRAVNLSATDAALEALQAYYRAGKALTRAEWREVIEEHAGNREDRGFARLEPAEQAALHERYLRDVERIGRMPGITLIAD